MSDSAPLPANISVQPPISRAVIIAVFAASLMVGALAISNQSYWIDEALSLIVAMAPNPTEAWQYAQAVSGSTLQMPLYQIYLYSWHKVFGSGEWAMRASNLPWFVFGQLAFLLLLRQRPKLALLGCLLAAISPILWVYLDETRPYVMQYAAACWLTAALVRLTARPTASGPMDHEPLSLAEITAIVAAAVVLFASSLIGVIWTGAFALAIASVLAREKSARPASAPNLWLIGLIALALLVGFTAYYVLTWHDAGRGYHRAGVSLLSLPFIAYELLGFSGFGPGKLQMRATPVASVLGSIPALLPLAATFAALGVFAVLGTRRHAKNKPAITAWLLALGLPTLVIFVAMFLFDHRPLPRHFIPALPGLRVRRTCLDARLPDGVLSRREGPAAHAARAGSRHRLRHPGDGGREAAEAPRAGDRYRALERPGCGTECPHEWRGRAGAVAAGGWLGRAPCACGPAL
jgi:hypothetical protein